MFPERFTAATALLERVGPWLLWLAALAGVVLLARTALPLLARRPGAAAEGPDRAEGRLLGAVAATLVAAFALLAWYHWRIWSDLPLALDPRAGAWLNAQFEAMARAGRGSLPPVDWAHPPRYAIPLWIEGEKFFFWALVYSFALFYPLARRAARPFRVALYAGLIAYLGGVVFFARPFTEPLAQFRGEIAPWFAAAGNVGLQIQAFFKLYPRMLFYYNAPYMWVHPPLLFAAYALLTVTFVACVFMLFSARREQEREAYVYAKHGYLLLTVGMLIGYPWALQAWGPNWWWDPKIAASIMMWLLYSGFLHTRIYVHRRRIWFLHAALGVLCYLSLMFTYFMAWYFPGEHTFQ
ncbi:MAG TPA: cytochrome c biogenesis protein CcsA [Candidatus Methanoperedens sp.]|nr:cytochrome c biogenesis protein CcsA [Candidatus Methanoperedens sp.]